MKAGRDVQRGAPALFGIKENIWKNIKKCHFIIKVCIPLKVILREKGVSGSQFIIGINKRLDDE